MTDTHEAVERLWDFIAAVGLSTWDDGERLVAIANAQRDLDSLTIELAEAKAMVEVLAGKISGKPPGFTTPDRPLPLGKLMSLLTETWIVWATQHTTDSDLPEGAIECPDCGGGYTCGHPDGAVSKDCPGCRDIEEDQLTCAQCKWGRTCPTCHGTGHVCEVCGGAVGEPKNVPKCKGSPLPWKTCTADYHTTQ